MKITTRIFLGITIILLVILGFYFFKNKKGSGKVRSVESGVVEQNIKDSENKKKIFLFKGMIDSKIPIELTYQEENSLLVGNILYTNSKEKKPIQILGHKHEGEEYPIRFDEFGEKGIVTGSISLSIKGESLEGIWTSPKTGKELKVNLTLEKENGSLFKDIKAKEDVAGEYIYRYGDMGDRGDVTIERINDKEVNFEVGAITGSPQYNTAQIEKVKIPLSKNETEFTYKISETEDGECNFKVKFYKDFLEITQTQENYCNAFGLNATIVGLYVKVK